MKLKQMLFHPGVFVEWVVVIGMLVVWCVGCWIMEVFLIKKGKEDDISRFD